MMRGIVGVLIASLLLAPGRVAAASCADLTVGTKVEITDEGVTKLSKTSRWKRTGEVTALTVRSLPDSVKVKRTLFTTDTIWCGFLRVVPEPSPTPVPEPVPVPVPQPLGPISATLTVNGSVSTVALDLTQPSVRLGPVSLYLYPYTFQGHQALDLTLADDQRVEDVNHPKGFAATAYTLELTGDFSTYAIGGERGQVYQGAVPPEGVTLYQGGEAKFANAFNGVYGGTVQWYDGVGQGTAAAGWALAGAQGVVVRSFAQQFPKGFRITPDRLVIELHPARASTEPYQPNTDYHRPKTFYFPREGGAKTYQLLFPTGVDVAALQRLAADFEEAPRPLTPPAFAPSPAPGYDDYLTNATLAPSLARVPSLIDLAGWRDFGDRLRWGWADVWYGPTYPADGLKVPAFYNDTHIGAIQFYRQWQRTQDPRWWRLFERSTRHFMDIDVSHARRYGYHFGGGLTSPAGEPHLIKHEVTDHTCRNIHAGHLHLSGLVDYWLTTHDPRAKDVLDEMGTWWVWWATRAFSEQATWPHWAEIERDFAWPLWGLTELHRATGDTRYLDTGAQVVRHLLSWFHIDQPHLQNGQVVSQNDADAGTGYWTMYPKCDNCPTGWNGAGPPFAGALLTALIDFREVDQGQRINQAALDDMILQGLEYVVKWGYLPEKGYFRYVEGSTIDGGSTPLLFPLAWGRRRLAQGVPHPEWFTTAAMWTTITDRAYADGQVIKWRGKNDLGFYGYEFIDERFWRLMRERQP